MTQITSSINRAKAKTNQTKTFKFGSIQKGGDKFRAEITIKLGESETGPVFSASGRVWKNRSHRECLAGQCLDSIANIYKRDAKVQKIVRLWKKNHLNNLHAGTPDQEAALRKAGFDNFACDYQKCVNYLEQVGLNPIMLDDGHQYRFGTGWIYYPITVEDLTEIYELLEE